MKRLLAMMGAAMAAASVSAGIKYWDNPEYKAFDVGDYVSGAVWNYDGIRNVGANADHDPAALTWVNLGSSGSANNVFLQKATGVNNWANASAGELAAGTYGSWSENGFVFKGNSRMRCDTGGIAAGSSYSLQFLLDAQSAAQQDGDGGFVLSVSSTHFALCIKKADSNLYWRTKMAVDNSNDYSSLGGSSFDYVTAIVNGSDNTTALFDGIVPPASGDGFRQYVSVSGHTENKYCLGSTLATGNAFKGTLKFFRYYNRALSNEELAWNRVVDEVRFFGRQTPLPVTNVVVASQLPFVNANQPNGCYALDAGGFTFTAPATTVFRRRTYSCTGYTVETWDGSAWSAPVAHDGETSYVATDGALVRITWQWTAGDGLVTYDIDDYVWNGLEVFYDGIRNVGRDLPHSTTTVTWKNLGSKGSVNDVFLQRLNAAGSGWNKATNLETVDGRDPGEWTANGFVVRGESRFRCNPPGGFAVGTNYALQMLIDARATNQVTNQSYPFGSQVDKLAFQIRRNDGVLFWKTLGPLSPDSLYPFMTGGTYDYMTAIMKDDNTQAFFSGTTIPTSGNGCKTNTAAGWSENGFCLGGYGSSGIADLFVGTLKNFRQYDHALSAADVVQNRIVDNWRYFHAPATTNIIVATTNPNLQGNDEDGAYEVVGSYTFTAPTSVTVKNIDYVCDGYTVETWDGSAWTSSTSYTGTSYAYATSAGLVRLTWKWKPVRGIRTAADYSYDDYSQAGLVWHYDGLYNAGARLPHSTNITTWVNLGSAGATYDMVKYLVGSKVDGEWTDDGYLFRGGTRFRVVGKPIGPFRSFSIQTLVDADIADQTSKSGCFIMSGIWDYFSMFFINGTAANAASLCCNFQGGGTGTSSETAVYFKNDSGHYDYAMAIMDYDAMTAQVFGGVEVPTSGTGFHQFSSVISRSDSGFGLGNSGGNGNDGLIGTLKLFRYYDRVLTEEEIVRNRNVDAVRYFGALGVTNVLVRTKYGAVEGEAEVLAEVPGAYKVEGSWTFSATSVKDKNGNLCPVAGFYTEELVDGAWKNKIWHEGQMSYTYDETTAAGKTIRLTWSVPPIGTKFIVR